MRCAGRIVVPCSVRATGRGAVAAGGEQVAQGAGRGLGGAEQHDGDVVARSSGTSRPCVSLPLIDVQRAATRLEVSGTPA